MSLVPQSYPSHVAPTTGVPTIGRSARPGSGVKIGRIDLTVGGAAGLNYLSGRFGLSDRTASDADHPMGEEMTTGPIAGPEGQGRGALALLQLAIDSAAKVGLALPGLPPGTIATEQDAVDATYVFVDGTNYWSRYVSPILALVVSGPPVVTPPGLGGGKTEPPVVTPPASVTASKLSPASVRVEELRVYARTLPLIAGGVTLGMLVSEPSWSSVKPFAVEALRFYRRVRAKLGDTRAIPAEDR